MQEQKQDSESLSDEEPELPLKQMLEKR